MERNFEAAMKTGGLLPGIANVLVIFSHVRSTGPQAMSYRLYFPPYLALSVRTSLDSNGHMSEGLPPHNAPPKSRVRQQSNPAPTQAMLDNMYQNRTALCQICIRRNLRTLNSLKILPLDQALHSSLHHANVWLKSCCQLANDLAE